MLLLILVIVIVAIPQMLFALALFRQSQDTDRHISDLIGLAQIAGLKTEELLRATAKIHDLTNSNLTTVKADLAAALQQIKSLQELVAAITDPQTAAEIAKLSPAMSLATRLDSAK